MDLKSFAMSLIEEVDISASEDLVDALRQAHASLQALLLVHLSNHWESSGPSQYGDHQLYERLYDAAKESLDKYAERVIGVFGPDSIGFSAEVTEMLASELDEHVDHASLIERAIHVEERASELLSKAWDMMKSEGVASPGLVDDLMPALIGARDESLYLLRQRNGARDGISAG